MRERDGLTHSELAERTGIAAATLSWWSWRLRREGHSRTTLVPVELVDDVPAVPGSGVSVELADDLVVHVDRDFDAETLGRVVRALSRGC